MPTSLPFSVYSLIDAPISASWKNVVIKAGTKPLRWAYSKGLMEKDITKGLILFAGKDKERHILSPEQAALIFRTEWKDPRTKKANMLAAVTGLRAGEILGLQVLHLATCVEDKIDFLLSWNCTHLGFRSYVRVVEYNAKNGLWTPLLVTPDYLLALEDEEEETL
ncbi:MAG: hypothetical protein LBU00_02585 [Treponema sp.]|jgi:hypothetical protein|nr:hypothetical protein [Treponema sp.]